MINITFTDNEKSEIVLEIKGHANYGEEGKDIVCAGVSTLFYTLANVLEDNKKMLKTLNYEMEKGEGTLLVTPKEEYQGNVQVMLLTVLTGFNLMASNYPHNVKLVVGRRVEKGVGREKA
ncbi:MAG: ribosomal-processing cysteine protease Prp [Lachnospiraceae bacterium]|nr:ribosomal-processing cysteine protease Prp [Lachnospiraceae bacterium]